MTSSLYKFYGQELQVNFAEDYQLRNIAYSAEIYDARRRRPFTVSVLLA